MFPFFLAGLSTPCDSSTTLKSGCPLLPTSTSTSTVSPLGEEFSFPCSAYALRVVIVSLRSLEPGNPPDGVALLDHSASGSMDCKRVRARVRVCFSVFVFAVVEGCEGDLVVWLPEDRDRVSTVLFALVGLLLAFWPGLLVFCLDFLGTALEVFFAFAPREGGRRLVGRNIESSSGSELMALGESESGGMSNMVARLRVVFRRFVGISDCSCSVRRGAGCGFWLLATDDGFGIAGEVEELLLIGGAMTSVSSTSTCWRCFRPDSRRVDSDCGGSVGSAGGAGVLGFERVLRPRLVLTGSEAPSLRFLDAELGRW